MFFKKKNVSLFPLELKKSKFHDVESFKYRYGISHFWMSNVLFESFSVKFHAAIASTHVAGI